MNVKSLVLAAATSGILLTGANAAELQVQSEIRDYEAILTPGTGAFSVSNGFQGDLRIGARTGTTLSSGIFGFALPALGTGETISAATLNVTIQGEDNRDPLAGANLDLYGLPFSSADPFDQDGTRHYQGPNDTTVGTTKLQDNFILSSDVPPGTAVTTVDKMSVDISAFLNSLYAAGADAGDFAVLRLSQDVVAAPTTVDRFRIVSSGGDGGTIDASPNTIAEGAPFLSITTEVIPEPSSLALLGLGVLGLARRRRGNR